MSSEPSDSMTEPMSSSVFTDENPQTYRSVSKAAICCLVFAILGLAAFLTPIFVVLPLIAVLCGLAAMMAFRRFPEELVGSGVNSVGLILGLVTLLGSTGYHSYIYVTEVPEGYERISFSDLKPSKKVRYKFSPKAIDFNGKDVFVKGYTRPSQKKTNLKQFIMVGDFGACCFGGTPKITDVIAVTIETDQTVDYSYRRLKIGGEFRLHENQAISKMIDEDVPNVFYEIRADYIK